MYSPSADEYKSTLFWVILGITLFWGWFHSKLQSIGLNWLLSNFESVFHYFEHVFPLYIVAISDTAPKRMQFHSCTLQTVHPWYKETWATTRLPNSSLFMLTAFVSLCDCMSLLPRKNANVKRNSNPNPDPNPNLNPYPTPNPKPNHYSHSLCCWRYHRRSNCVGEMSDNRQC